MNDTFSIIYMSLATRELDEQDLDLLLEQSRRNNEAREITGLLLYLENLFIQLLEGPEAKVTEVYERIVEDDRNRDNVVLKKGFFGPRVFTNWSMGFQTMDKASFASRAGFFDVDSTALFSSEEPPTDPFLNLLRSFYDINFRKEHKNPS